MGDPQWTKEEWFFRTFCGEPGDLEKMKELGMAPVQNLSNEGQRYIMAGDKRVALVDCQTSYKRGQGHKTECAERDANAHLIIAAKDLYEALEIAEVALCKVILNRPQNEHAPTNIALGDIAERARAALTKARGGVNG